MRQVQQIHPFSLQAEAVKQQVELVHREEWTTEEIGEYWVPPNEAPLPKGTQPSLFVKQMRQYNYESWLSCVKNTFHAPERNILFS